jgi:alpha-tubulin suppressor-like RCC1 family protein
MALDSNGYLYSAGCSQYGQLGNGETGEHFITANKLAFANCTSLKRRSTFCQEDISSSSLAGAASSRNSSSNKDQRIVPILQEDDILIQQVVCGKHHTVAVEASCTSKKLKPRVFTWGCGDYGCLGHGVQKDEYFPRAYTLNLPVFLICECLL